MSVYVDRLTKYPTTIKCFQPGSCHMYADTMDELHQMADKLGLKRAWFQLHDVIDHYDLTKGKRILAIKAGVIEDLDWQHFKRLKKASLIIGEQ